MLSRGALGSVLVLVGGLVTQALPGTSPVAEAPLLEPLREAQAGRMAGLVVVVAGLALLGSAWLRLLTRTHPDTGLPVAVRQRQVHAAAAAWSLPLLVAPPLFSRDGWSYAAQGALTHLGLSPYVWTPSILDGQIREAVDPIWWHTPAPYGPLPLAWGSGIAAITDNPWMMVVGHRLLALLGLIVLAWAVPRLARAGGADPARAAAIALASPLTIAHGVGGLHNDLAMAALMAAALALALDRWWLLGAVLAGTAAAVKLPGGLVGIGVALVSLPVAASLLPRMRRLATVAVVAVGVLFGLGVVVGVGHGWVDALGTPAAVPTPLSLTTQLGLLTGQTSVVRGLGLALVAGGIVWVALRGRTGDAASSVRDMAILSTALVVLSPAVREWYLLWPLPFLAAVAWRRPIEQLVRDLALVLGIAAPLDSSLRGAPAEIVVVVALVVLTVVRLRTQDVSREARPSRASHPVRGWRGGGGRRDGVPATDDNEVQTRAGAARSRPRPPSTRP
ncbi:MULTISPECIES: polyprenol phosphomannose-dependent alpha 1,6 mannosyltransferase MptB [unclassified Nocardioides]|uniref:polyprenol phosphomannose-dependent alpha 1,6 mannosyltransferase MptB n=1 Tax=unclassified Nocardioides TaxID=2615069 RepID=UPI003610CAC9